MSDKLAPASRHQFTHNGQVVYEWDQTLDDVNLYVVVPPGALAKHLFCEVTKRHVKLGIKGNPPYLDKNLASDVKVQECFWTLEDGVLHITLQKMLQGQAWPSAIAGHGPEAGTPEAEVAGAEDKSRLMLERFQLEHPGFDFSGATFNGEVPDAHSFLGGIGRT